MIDMAKHRGKTFLDTGESLGPDDINAVAKAQGVEICQGDIVLFHTAWTDAMLEKDPKASISGEPGIDNAGAVYLARRNVMAVGADRMLCDDKAFYGHVTLLKENGIYILETMNTGRLAKEGVHEFVFVLGQARVKGTVQMIINPIAMW